jgi:hypothetical protein
MKIIFVTSCKPITNESLSIIQKNSIDSWLSLDIEKKILIINKDQSVKNLFRDSNVTIIEDYECSNHSDIPTWRTMRDKAVTIADKDDIIVWVNSDVMFDKSLVETINVVRNEVDDFVLVGQKLDWQNFYNLKDFSRISELTPMNLHGEWAIDYFIFKKNAFENVPPFFIARMRFDNFLMNKAINEYTAIDCTETILCVHHRHDYGQNIDSIFSQVYETDFWQNEQKVNDSLIFGNLSNIKGCNFFTKKENQKIIISKKI